MPVGAAVLAAGVVSAGAGIYSANKAAKAQTSAAAAANNTQLSMFNQTQSNLAPFVAGGGTAFKDLQGLTGTGPGGDPLTAPLTKPFTPTMTDLENTPGYKFTLDQGLKATQNGYAAQGLANSGAAIKGAGDYATGLASNTYQQQFQNYLNQNAQISNLLLGQSSLGESAAAGQGNIAAQTGANIGANTIGAGNANAAAAIGTGNAVSNAATTGANNYVQYSLLNSLLSPAPDAGLTAKTGIDANTKNLLYGFGASPGSA